MEYETALAHEGGAGQTEESRAAFAEKFALAADIEAKRTLVTALRAPGSADSLYFGSLCTLLELQSLLDEARPEADEQAFTLLSVQKPHLDSAMSAIRIAPYAEKRANRLQGRLKLLELEILQRMRRSEEELKVSLNALFVVA